MLLNDEQIDFIKSVLRTRFRKNAVSNSFVLFYTLCILGILLDSIRLLAFIQILIAFLLVLIALYFQTHLLNKNSYKVLRKAKIQGLNKDLKYLNWRISNDYTISLFMLIFMPSALFLVLDWKLISYLFMAINFSILFSFVFSLYQNAIILNSYLDNILLDTELNEYSNFVVDEDKFCLWSIFIGLFIVIIMFSIKYWNAIMAFYNAISK